MILRIAPIWLLLLGLPAWGEANKETPQDMYLKIYVQMHDAENFEKKGDLQSAYTLFVRCYQELKLLCESDPITFGHLRTSLKNVEGVLRNLRIAFARPQLHQPWCARTSNQN